MQNQNLTLFDLRITRTNGSSSQTTVQSSNRTFTFTGFNANGDFIHPTAGTYNKNHVSFCGGKTLNQVLDPPGSRTVTEVFGPQSGFVTGGHAPSMSSPSSQEWDNIRNRALDRLYDKINHQYTNLSVDIAEGHETRRMISKAVQSARGIVSAVRKVVRTVKHGDIVPVLSNAWLQWQYGWRPLVKSVYGLLEFTTNRFANGYTFRCSAKEPMRSWQMQKDDLYPHIVETWGGEGFNRVSFSVTATMADQTAFDRAAITSLDPVSIAWELVPYSFVVDWFYDIGGYLALQEAALGNGMVFNYGHETRISVWRSWKREVGAGITGAGTPVSPRRLTSSDLSSKRYQVGKTRIKLTAFPRPRRPTLKVNLGAQRILSAGALLANLMRPSGR